MRFKSMNLYRLKLSQYVAALCPRYFPLSRWADHLTDLTKKSMRPLEDGLFNSTVRCMLYEVYS
jgi:hypothetical protein